LDVRASAGDQARVLFKNSFFHFADPSFSKSLTFVAKYRALCYYNMNCTAIYAFRHAAQAVFSARPVES
jgi:hypothetical protein